jgi:hypothetical protein
MAIATTAVAISSETTMEHLRNPYGDVAPAGAAAQA